MFDANNYSIVIKLEYGNTVESSENKTTVAKDNSNTNSSTISHKMLRIMYGFQGLINEIKNRYK
ncbi:hypothetical protein [Clostridium butyricum]|uniref:hypothetical protein n=1 Tax=Clostridium butyricum TaxID=1492 RepID=UPI00374EEA96